MPKSYLKSYNYLLHYGSEVCGEVTTDNAETIAHSFRSYLNETPDLDAHKGECSRDRYFSALGLIYGMVLEKSFGWKPCWLVFEEDDYDPEDGVDSVVSPDNKYAVFPIALVRRDFYQKTDIAGLLYDKIMLCDLPEANSGDFLELKS